MLKMSLTKLMKYFLCQLILLNLLAQIISSTSLSSAASLNIIQVLNFSSFTACYQNLKLNLSKVGSNSNNNVNRSVCSIEEPTETANIDLVALNKQHGDDGKALVTICISLCRYKQTNQSICQGFNVRFDSSECELYRFGPVYFAQQDGCSFYALKPANSSAPALLPNTSLTFLVQLKLNESSTSFDRSWSQFKSGFSVPTVSASSNPGCCGGGSWDVYWLGNELLYQLTNMYKCGLHVYRTVNNGKPELQYSYYDQFRVASESYNYRLDAISYASGNCSTYAGLLRAESYFSTYDKDNDVDSIVNCAAVYRAGWWYSTSTTVLGNCGFTNYNSFQPYFITYYNGLSFQMLGSQMWMQCV
ncbi:hypothetical protein HELRODRAFT_171209 [Helobdella robusta]|uniref:Fibrinogen C-terminal domain-containing protein n=1 Tax=Helobdella robusta TaxID=6412 RepID=T1F3Y1_HELRO|nr:hypothetical protein HELRODRAFT_171209 [Helobdella robusta]ESO05568.1 hypothetical protein HELRODRAFT_171209 [Helobdella robusta]